MRSHKSLIKLLLILQGLDIAAAGTVRSDVSYQYYRDLAENKGQFTPGARDIKIYKKDGTLLDNAFDKAPVPSFAGVDRNGIATLVGDQYTISVAHNVGYKEVQFGREGYNPDYTWDGSTGNTRYKYSIVNRHNVDKNTVRQRDKWTKGDPNAPYHSRDYHNPRLNKFVTEAAPFEIPDLGTPKHNADKKETDWLKKRRNGNVFVKNIDKYVDIIRIGSGTQQIAKTNRNVNNGRQTLRGAYSYLTAGDSMAAGGRDYGWIDGGYTYYDNSSRYGQLKIGVNGGDSGSPLLAYDKDLNKWVVIGVLVVGNNHGGASWNVARRDYLDKIVENDFVKDNEMKIFNITKSNNGNDYIFKLNQPDNKSPDNKSKKKIDPDTGKNIRFSGSGTLTLENNINQYAGGLYFDGN
ncbi:MAG: S6 family peptidase, partial [Helicobacter sp.]|nr:S6 family peptidase [Helicobacter sp.]